MYESFYKFEKPPFKLVADPSMLFISDSVREVLARLEYVVRTSKGLAVMTGEVGTGKTTLVNRFLAKAGPELRTAYIFNPTLSGFELLKTLAEELGIQTASLSKLELTRAIYEQLLRDRGSGRLTVVFVDEAQVLSREALEELRLVSNLETWQEKLLHIVLVGQPELLQLLDQYDLRQLQQRVELFLRIEPMQTEETRRYIQHRLRVANPLRRVHFTADAARQVHQRAGGVPREINKLCDAALTMAFVAEADVVTSRHVKEAAANLGAPDRPVPRRPWWAGRSLARHAATLAAASALVALLVTQEGSLTARAPDSAELAASDSAALVHLASFRARAQAEDFASQVDPGPGYRVYLQSVEQAGQVWHRVFLGDFANLDEAERYATAARQAGLLAYARPARVAVSEIEVVASPTLTGGR